MTYPTGDFWYVCDTMDNVGLSDETADAWERFKASYDPKQNLAEHITKLSVQDGDLLVVKSNVLEPKEIDKLVRLLKEAGRTDVVIVVIAPGDSLETLSKEHAAKLLQGIIA